MERFYTLWWWCFVLSISQAQGVSESLLYEYANIGTNLPTINDVSSEEVKLRVPIIFYGQTYSSIFVNENGLLSFQTDIPAFFNIEFPLDYPVIAPLYSNVDISSTGTISYYETNNAEHLARATNAVHESFSYSEDFEATSLLIVTWSQVGYHRNGVDKLNTFQVVVASDGDDSFVELIYPENSIQWIQGTGDQSGLPDARAQAGFVATDGRYYLLPGSGTDQIKNLDKWSNVNKPGQWIFRVGRLDPDANIEEPDTYLDAIDNGIPKTCEKGLAQCHGFAKCIDHNEGFCCVCRQNYYGNGKYCVKNDVPIRVNGKVNGKINGVQLSNLDLQSYIVMADARAYTAISKIPEFIGFDIQSVQVLGGVLGWLFAKPIGDAVNGFQLTGGVFNHTSTILFTDTKQKTTVRHKYVGLDVFDQLRLEADVIGDIPHLPGEPKVTFSEYEEQYTLTAANTIQSSSSRVFTYTDMDGQEIVVPFTIDQSFVFESCKFEARPVVGTTWRLKVGKNFISYEAKEQIVRFGLSNKVGPLGDIDPCHEGRAACGSNSACVVENDSYRCVCNPGYQYIYKDSQEGVCQDINECQTGIHDCDYDAECINEIGGYSCKCHYGFEGNGRYCDAVQSCRNIQCPENSECVQRQSATCQCIPGFTGNGQACTKIVEQGCQVDHNCSPYGYCAQNPQNRLYSCLCNFGFTGDGYECYPEESDKTTTTEMTTSTEEVVAAQCLFTLCVCPYGYELQEDGYFCRRIVETTTDYFTTTESATETRTEQVSYPEAQCFANTCFCPRGFKLDKSTNTCRVREGVNLETMGASGFNISCDVINNCHRNAQCVYEISVSSYQCVCNIGFEGDGYKCRESAVSCSDVDVCDFHANCLYSESLGRSICVCDPGYVGNGEECFIADCNSNDDCPLNEECVYSYVPQTYECVCKEGFNRDSQQQCVQLFSSCGGGTCTDNAECLYDEEYQTYYCSCKADYVGDGITECKPKPIECNVNNNCALHAACTHNQREGVYECKCNEGYYGDGLVCYVERNCNSEPSICDRRAVCLTNADRKYICECQPGFIGNGTVCKESPRHDGNFLLLNQGKATLRIPFDASQKNLAKLTHISEDQTAVGLDIDCLAGRVYWSDISGRVIKSSAYNGSKVVDFIKDDIGSPEGLSIDWISRNIYWTDSTKDTIEVANIETKLRAVLFNTSLVNPRGIAVHPQRGKIFWTDWDRASPKIEWANADGTGREIFLQGESVKLPNSLVIDFDMERLCYADAGTKRIECLDIDSRYRQIIADNCTYPYGITVTDEHIYWSDWIVKKIERVDKQSLHRLPPLDVPLGGTNKLYSLVAVPERCLGLSNVCQYYKNQCPAHHICLPDGGGSRRCICGHKVDSPLEKPPCNL